MSGQYEEISRRAYEMWEQEGKPVGRDQEFWFRAEEAIRSRSGRAENGSSVTAASSAQDNSSSKPKGRRTSKAQA